MSHLIYWCVYNLDLGPFGPTALNLAPRVWQKQAKRRSRVEAGLDQGNRGFLNQPHLVKATEAAL
jgi:hypothetical protein